MIPWVSDRLSRKLSLSFALILGLTMLLTDACLLRAVGERLPAADLKKLAWELSGIAFVMAGAAAWAALRLCGAIARPISEISRVAERLARGEQGARVGPLPRDEHGKLGAALNHLAEKIQQDFSQLRRLEQMRKDFVANVSHELRTPLAAIKAFAETLRSGAVEDAEHRLEFLEEIETNTDRMTRLVDDLLELSAIESGSRPPHLEPVSLMRVAGEVTASLKPLAEKKQVVLRLEPFHDIPEVRADRGQLKQVFTNLLDNAIKYTGDKGTVRITAMTEDGRVTVAIEDTGSGIPEEHLPRIFERFYRVDKARSRELGGTGLGLAIVKHIVEAHDGSVAVESAPGRGSIFRFSLPTTG